MYFLGTIFALAILGGIVTLIWFAIIEIIKCHKKRMKALNQHVNEKVNNNHNNHTHNVNLSAPLLDQP
jgi:TM2 domain-containing membrane protein YozV